MAKSDVNSLTDDSGENMSGTRKCPFCGTDVLTGYNTCTGCHAYEASWLDAYTWVSYVLAIIVIFGVIAIFQIIGNAKAFNAQVMVLLAIFSTAVAFSAWLFKKLVSKKIWIQERHHRY